ncbi:MAG: ABC transporter substrate-binding protein [Desulfobacterales bacterium]
MKRSIGLIFVLATAIAAILVFGSPVSASDKSSIELGCAISFTGDQSRSGKLYRDSYDMAVDRINDQGGVKVGGKTYKLKIVYFDDKSDPTESSRLVEKLISEDKVAFLLGPYSSGITIPDSIVAQRYRVPMIEGGEHRARYSAGATNTFSAPCRRPNSISNQPWTCSKP